MLAAEVFIVFYDVASAAPSFVGDFGVVFCFQPEFGLIIVPTSGRVGIFRRLRIPAMPKAGPLNCD